VNIQEATTRYEAWLGQFMPLVRADIAEKHRRMLLNPFRFLRATFYRWCQLWRRAAGDAARAPAVLAVGDLHIENFGTWRDTDGRLIWGINDFDEATTLPWTQDLVRLAVGAHLAIGGEVFGLGRRAACDAILEGYRAGLEAGGPAFVLEEEHTWLRRMAMTKARHPTAFWQRLDALPTLRTADPAAVAAIETMMPAPDLEIRYAHRVAGMGSLGRPRIVGIANWRGGLVAREAKAMAPSAWRWAAGRKRGGAIAYETIVGRAIRVPDPTVRLMGSWLVRRLAPHCTRIELIDLPDVRDEMRLLYAMGFETANVHLGTKHARRAVLKDLKKRKARWLHELAKELAIEVIRDWKDWRRSTAGP
jgi:hypothetical protein